MPANRTGLTQKLTRDMRAYHIERRRWPALTYLKTGTKLTRLYQGLPYTVTIEPCGYSYNDTLYATLKDVTAAIVRTYRLPQTGVMGYRLVCTYSTKRFWFDAVLAALAL